MTLAVSYWSQTFNFLGCVNPFYTNVKQYIPLAAKDLSISLGSKNPNISSMSANALQRRLTLLGTLVLKLYVKNAIQSPVHYYQIIKKTFLSPSGIEPATDVLGHNISVALSRFLPVRQLLLF